MMIADATALMPRTDVCLSRGYDVRIIHRHIGINGFCEIILLKPVSK